MTNEPVGHSWWPYVAPMLAFLLLVELSGRVSEDLGLVMLGLRVAVPLGLLLFFRSRGAYPELRFRPSAMTLADLSVGILLAGVWVIPYLVFPSLRPPIEETSFDPVLAGKALVPLVLVIRMFGFAVVTPVMEELFMRSFLIRMVDVFDTDKNFREIPIGTFAWRSFLAVVAVFVATHVPWEWWVMVPWAILSTLWLYYRKSLFALVVVHAATNASILLAAIYLSEKFSDGSGGFLSLWFFV